MTLAEGRRARANLCRVGCKAPLRCAAVCGEEEEARKKQAELRHRGEGEVAPGLLGEGLRGKHAGTSKGQDGEISPTAPFCRNWGRDAPGSAGRSKGWGSRKRLSSRPGANSAAKWFAAIPKGQRGQGWMGGKRDASSERSSTSAHFPPPPLPTLDLQSALSADNNPLDCKIAQRSPKAAPAL